MNPRYAVTGTTLLALMLAAFSPGAHANGCIVVRSTSDLMVDLDDADHQSKAGSYDFTLSYRNFYSHRHFVGTEEQTRRGELGNEVKNHVTMTDFTLAYWYDDKWRFSASLPYQHATRSSISDGVTRHWVKADGIGDLRLMAFREMLGPQHDVMQGITLGLGVKLPTGKDNVKDTALTRTGSVYREVDQSIQPGDGGTGLILAFQAYREIFGTHSTFAFASGSYLINPRNTNGVPTYRGDPNESIMSVPDTYQARAGITQILSREKGLGCDLAVRIEGVPVRDLVGGSDGFRRPGYAVYVEPGISFQKGPHRGSLAVPIAVQRNRQISVADEKRGAHGDAAFADYLVLANYTYSF